MKKSDSSGHAPPDPPGKGNAALSDWKAKHWSDLRSIWEELVPQYYQQQSSPKLKGRFRESPINARQSGYVFERWVIEAFRLCGYETESGWRVPGGRNASTREQIDGLVLEGWQAFLVESKFQEGKVDYAPIAVLHSRVGQRPPGCMGLFFSAFGFTIAALETAMLQQPMRVLLFNGSELTKAVESEAAWKGMVIGTWVKAVKFGYPYLQ